MSTRSKAATLAVALWLSVLPLCRAQSVAVPKMGPDLQVTVSTFVSGHASISAWPRDAGRDLAPVLPEVLHCPGNVGFYPTTPNAVLCLKALRRDGLALEGVVDLAPIARKLDPSTGIELWLDTPRLGFDSTSMAMTEMGGGTARLIRSIHFEAGSLPPPIKIRFGYRPIQLAAIYLPLVALALALMLIAGSMSRAGLASLSRSSVLLGTIVWMGAAAQLEADGPLRILLYGTSFANLALLFVRFWPPLLCVAIGVAVGNRMRVGRAKNRKSGEILRGMAFIPLILTCAAGTLLSLENGEVTIAPIWLATPPILFFLYLLWRRASGRVRVTQIRDGELKERVSALAVKAGCPHARVYVLFSKRSAILNAFARPRRGILFTAPLVRSLSRREMDAIAAHELTHLRHSHSYLGMWLTLLCLAMVFFETPLTTQLQFWPGGLFAALLLLVTVFFASMRTMRKREFAADTGSTALTGDPQAMISSLLKITRKNNIPLDMNPAIEWFSSHPSTPKRIRALAAAANLEPAEVESLCGCEDQGAPYELPQEEESSAIRTPVWRRLLPQPRLMAQLIRKRARELLLGE